MKRVGVFICHCGSNIGAIVDCERVAKVAAKFPGVAYSVDNKYMCSDPGQDLIKKAVEEHNLDRVVVASCTPRMHEPVFRNATEKAGINPYLFCMTNIREHCSWIHTDREAATEKAIDLVRMAVAKVLHTVPLEKSSIPITKRALVIGGGIAGMQAALDIAENGNPVVLVEREPTIGGKMPMLDKTFPSLDCSACICTPKMADTNNHPNITVYTHSEVESVSGYIGNFEVTIRLKAKYVDHDICTGCGTCESKCPNKKIPNAFESGMGNRTAIYKPFPQAVPNKPIIDAANCRKLTKDKCGICAKVCPVGAIKYDDKDELITVEVGTIVMATGYDLFEWEDAYGEYGYGKYPNVITSMQFERLVNASGPTSGHIVRPSDGKEPKTIVFIKCVGSRDDAKGKAYCSRTCCMYTAKHAHQACDKIEDSNIIVFYMDVRCAGKGYEEFYQRTVEDGAQYVRGRVSKIYPQGEKLIVLGQDTILGESVEVEADMVVLATAMVPSVGSGEIAHKVGFSADKDGFYQEAHPKLRPLETFTAGVFLAGCCQGPKDIPDTAAQGSGAAAKASAVLSKSSMITDPLISGVNEDLCSGCGSCVAICPYKAIELIEKTERLAGEDRVRLVASVNRGLCQGCGACVVACRPGALDLKGFTNQQLIAEVDALCL
jgi:heterodisulfide reductase subunit A